MNSLVKLKFTINNLKETNALKSQGKSNEHPLIQVNYQTPVFLITLFKNGTSYETITLRTSIRNLEMSHLLDQSRSAMTIYRFPSSQTSTSTPRP